MVKGRSRIVSAEMKGEMQMLNILRLYDSNLETITEVLTKKIKEAPQFFQNTPLIVDCQSLQKKADQLNFASLYHLIVEYQFAIVGIRNLPRECHASAKQAGWLILRDSPENRQKKIKKNKKKHADSPLKPEDFQSQTKVITQPVRSGQQIYMPNGNLVVVAHTSSGSELLASGSVHIYGKLRGRVLAGINGDKTARIFCQNLEAELIAIAGNYQLLDEAKTPLKGRAAMIRLENEKLLIEPIV